MRPRPDPDRDPDPDLNRADLRRAEPVPTTLVMPYRTHWIALAA